MTLHCTAPAHRGNIARAPSSQRWESAQPQSRWQVARASRKEQRTPSTAWDGTGWDGMGRDATRGVVGIDLDVIGTGQDWPCGGGAISRTPVGGGWWRRGPDSRPQWDHAAPTTTSAPEAEAAADSVSPSTRVGPYRLDGNGSAVLAGVASVSGELHVPREAQRQRWAGPLPSPPPGKWATLALARHPIF